MPIEIDEFEAGTDGPITGVDRFYGKYRGTVVSNTDPLQQGRIQAIVPEVLGEIPSGWAVPCVPYAGPLAGYFSLPVPGAAVWIEFEAGDPSRPIWTGGWWPAPGIPTTIQAGPAQPTQRLWRTETGLSVQMDDLAQTITIGDGFGIQMVEINMTTATVTVKGLARAVTEAPLVHHGSASAAHPHVKGDLLLAYLGQLVGMLQAHIHPGETAVGILPVTPAPPQPVFPLPTPSLLSTKVFVE